nr:hypothetical protein [Tanacetum cinerariifolium]
MTTLAEHIIVAGAENRPPMLEKSIYDSWASHIRLFIKGKKHGGMMLDLIDNGPLVYPTVEENGQTRLKKLYDMFDEFAFVHGETFKFVTDVKLAKSLYTTTYDYLYVYLSQHERHAHAERVMRERYPDPLALGENPIDCINKALAFMFVVASRNKGNDTNLRGTNAAGQPRVVKCYNYQREGHMARQCTQPKRTRNTAWFKEKLTLAEAEEAGQILNEEQLAFLADPGMDEAQVAQQIIPQNAVFQTKILDAYDSDCDDLSSAKAVLMANLSSCNSDVLFELEAFKKEIDTLKETLSNNVKEKESLSTTLNVFKTQSKEKESKYIDKEIVLEKQNKELENIIYCDDLSSAKAVLMANLSSCNSDVLFEVPYSDSYPNNILNHGLVFCDLLVEAIWYTVQAVCQGSTLFLRSVRIVHCASDLSFLTAGNVAAGNRGAQNRAGNANVRNEKVKHHYKELYDSITLTRAKTIEKPTSLLDDIKNLKAQLKNKMKCVTVPAKKPKVLAPRMYAIDVEPIPPRNRNNRKVHLDYLKHLKESAVTLREIVEEARVDKPLDSLLVSACLYTKHSQELLEYVIDTCPKDFNARDKKLASTPFTKKNQVTFKEPCKTLTYNIPTHPEQQKMKKTNEAVIPSTGVKGATSASGSKPMSNTKKDRTLPTKSAMKKVEDHPRNNKSSVKRKNRVDSSISYKRT